MRFLLAAALPLLGGCFVLGSSNPMLGTAASDWYEIAPVTKPLPEVLAASREVVRRAGFTLLPPDGTDCVYTEWLVQLSMAWRDGYRTKIELEVLKLEGSGLKVRIRGIREMNDNMRNASNPQEAQWVSASLDDRQKARIPEYALKIHQLLKLKLLEN